MGSIGVLGDRSIAKNAQFCACSPSRNKSQVPCPFSGKIFETDRCWKVQRNLPETQDEIRHGFGEGDAFWSLITGRKSGVFMPTAAVYSLLEEGIYWSKKIDLGTIGKYRDQFALISTALCSHVLVAVVDPLPLPILFSGQDPPLGQNPPPLGWTPSHARGGGEPIDCLTKTPNSWCCSGGQWQPIHRSLFSRTSQLQRTFW